MSSSTFQCSDAMRSGLRALISTIEAELFEMPEPTLFGRQRLIASWKQLVELMDVGPEPEKRTCPRCHHVGMRAATRCGFCWGSLALLEPQILAPVLNLEERLARKLDDASNEISEELEPSMMNDHLHAEYASHRSW